MYEVPLVGWAVIVIRQGAEFSVTPELGRRGVRVWLPLRKKLLRGVRLDDGGNRIRTRKPGELVLRPLLPGYAFGDVEVDQDYHDIMAVPGVISLLRSKPTAPLLLVPDNEVETLRERVDSGEFDDNDPTPRNNDRIAIDQDELGALGGKLLETDDRGRRRALLNLLGRVGVPARISAAMPLVRVID